MNLYEICEQKLKYLNYSKRTSEIYLNYIDRFLSSVSKPPSRITSKDFQSYLDNYSFTSVSQQNQVINSIRFLYKHVLEKKYNKVYFKRPKKEKKLPRVISKEVLKTKIGKIDNLKHKAILSLAYSTGLRVSEILNLKVRDVDSDRMLIHVVNGKGRKDRYVPLSNKLLGIFRDYFREYRPKEYLFEGQKSGKYSSSSCNNIVKKYIDPAGHMHLLRHSCFTSLLEQGTDIRIIQKIAGHNSSKTTEIYTHVSNDLLKNIQLPI